MSEEMDASITEQFEGILSGTPPEDLAPADAGQAEQEVVEEQEIEAQDDGQSVEVAEAEAQSDDEIDEGDTSEESDTAPEIVEIIVDGQTVRLTPEEVQGHYLRHADYTRKTQAHSEEKKVFEAEKTAFQQEIQQERAKQAQIMQQLAQMWQQEEQPNWDEIFEENPLEAPLMHHKWKQQQEERQQIMMQNQQAMVAQKQTHLAEQAKMLSQYIPQWRDGAVAERETLELRNALVEDGFNPEDVGAITDARLVKWLLAGHRQFQLEKQAPQVAKKKVAGKPKVLKPGSAKVKSDKRSNLKKKLDAASKTQSRDDFNSVFEELLG